MSKILKKVILLAMFMVCCATLFLTWYNVQGLQTLNGLSILTGNLFLTIVIFTTYLISILFSEKSPKVLFCVGLCSLSMFFAVMLSKFEGWGRFANKCIGPYVGLLSVIVTIVLYIVLNTKKIDK